MSACRRRGAPQATRHREFGLMLTVMYAVPGHV
jgi:hypothetical protein